MELYESMNEKIADIIAIDGTPSSLYASVYIKDLRAENARLKSETEIVKQQAVTEFAKKLLAELDEQKHFYETASITHREEFLAALGYAIKHTKRLLKELYPNA